MASEYRIGIVGAGTMGSGIAQLSILAGCPTRIFDSAEAQLQHGVDQLAQRVRQRVARSKLDESEADGVLTRLHTARALDELADCDLIIEAITEDIDSKRSLFENLAEIVRRDCVLATNTSSLSVTAIARGLPCEAQILGLHFFNPPYVLRCVEMAAGTRTSQTTLNRAQIIMEHIGQQILGVADVPGFVVNRGSRPFSNEALRLVEEGLADCAQIDRVCRLGGGFRMGPFELMDLVGLDVSYAVSKSLFTQGNHEPRWRPSPLLQEKVAAGELGRKAGKGWYTYPTNNKLTEQVSHNQGANQPNDEVIISGGASRLARELCARAEIAGWSVSSQITHNQSPTLIIDCDHTLPPRYEVPVLTLRNSRTCPEQPNTVGFFALAPLESCHLVELSRSSKTSPETSTAAEFFFTSLGFQSEWVNDAPGLILGRIVSQLINEASFTLGAEIASVSDINLGMKLALNYPRGPFEWAELIGIKEVIKVLEALYAHYGEPRYRLAPLLRAAADAPTDSQPLLGSPH